MIEDIEITKKADIKLISEVLKKLPMNEADIAYYGKYIAKINYQLTGEELKRDDAKLILVTAITPTPFGEGKTTMSIGLVDSLNKIGVSALGALREPSLGPVLGMKGGATGGGYAQIIPKEKINLHFTGDIHAMTTAHNFISAAIDNTFHFGNPLNLDKDNMTWPRALDMNDRALRQIETKTVRTVLLLLQLLRLWLLSVLLQALKT